MTCVVFFLPRSVTKNTSKAKFSLTNGIFSKQLNTIQVILCKVGSQQVAPEYTSNGDDT